MAMQGTHSREIDDDIKERFLELVANGYTRPEAAAALEISPRQIRACCSPQSHRYDDAFAKEYARITEPEGEHHTGLVERLRSAGIERAVRSSDRLLEKYSIIHDPDWAVHKPQSMQINFNADRMQMLFPQLSTETLEQMARELEDKQRRALGPGEDVIDA